MLFFFLIHLSWEVKVICACFNTHNACRRERLSGTALEEGRIGSVARVEQVWKEV